jgi:hypothetical protein
MKTKKEISREAIKILREQTPKKIAEQLASIQPMSTGAGAIFDTGMINPWSEWRKTTSIWPRRSINGKIIFGRINKRGRNVWDGAMQGKATRKHEYATNKELFERRLRGDDETR